MSIFIYFIFGIVVVLLAIQIRYIVTALCGSSKSSSNNLGSRQYEEHVINNSTKIIHAVEAGHIRKQITGNHSSEYDKHIAELKERRYHG